MRKLLVITALAVCSGGISFGALGVMAIDIRPTVGASTNGGAFVVGAAGTDMSIFNSKNAAVCTFCQSAIVNISTTDGVTAGTTTITSATGNYSSALIGNVVYITGGTGSVTAARYEVKTVPGATSFTVDRSTGLTAGTGVTINIGGALDGTVTALLFNTSGSQLHVKSSGTLSISAAFTPNNSVSPNFNAPANQLIGYNTTHFDCDNFIASPCAARPTIQASAGSFTMINGSAGASGWNVRDLILDCNSQTACTGLSPFLYWSVTNVKVINFKSHGINASQNTFSVFMYNEISGGANGCSDGMNIGGGSNLALFNWIHDSGCTAGISVSGNSNLVKNVVSNITNSGDGIDVTGSNVLVLGNTIYAAASIGISISDPVQGQTVLNNIIVNSGTWGLSNGGSAGLPAFPAYDGNWFYNNSSGTRRSLDDTGSTNAINGQHYTNLKDVAGAGDPFVNAAGNDFRLSTTAAGLSARSVAIPGVIPGQLAGFEDFGAIQSQYGQGSAGGGGASAYAQ